MIVFSLFFLDFYCFSHALPCVLSASVWVPKNYPKSLRYWCKLIHRKCSLKTLELTKPCSGNVFMFLAQQRHSLNNYWEQFFFKISAILTIMASMRAKIKAKARIFIVGRVLWKHMWQISNTFIPVLSNHLLTRLWSAASRNWLEVQAIQTHCMISWDLETRRDIVVAERY